MRTVAAIVFLTTCSIAEAQPFSFLPAVTYPAGTGPVAATSADFNNDGIPDLAISNASTIQIFLGKGDGTFKSAASIPLSGQCVATSLTAGDFNNDHKVDILAVCLFESEVQVTLGTGSGQFGPPVVTSLPGLAMYGFFAMFNFQDLTVADFNGDGTLDMVIGTMTEFPETQLTLMTGNGDGTFTTGNIVDDDASTNAVLTDDFNGDGIPDLAVSFLDASEQAGIDILLGDGKGSFQKINTYSVVGAGFAGCMALADVNGDGTPDIILATASASGKNSAVSYLTVLTGDGKGAFTQKFNVTTSGPTLFGMVAAKFSGGSTPDLLEEKIPPPPFSGGLPLSAITMTLRQGNGDGTFQDPVPVSVPNGVAPFWTNIAVDDFNGDGLPDIAFPAIQPTGVLPGTQATPDPQALNQQYQELPAGDLVVMLNGLAPPTVTTVLPHVADGNGFDTVSLLINTGTSTANYALQYFNQSGAAVTYALDPMSSPMSGTIAPGSRALVRTGGSGNSTHLGWGRLTASATVKGMLIYQQQASPTSFQEGSAPFTAPSTHFFVPFDNTSGSTTSIGFVNPSSSQRAKVTFTVRYATGGTDNVPAFSMNPLQQTAETVTSAWPNTTNQRGLIEVNATSPVGLVAFRFQGAALTLFDTIAPTADGSTPITSTIAHSADGDNFKSTFILTNSGTVAAPYTLNILNATGQTQTFGFDVASPLSGTVPAGSTLTIDTTGTGSVTNLGWAQLSSPSAVSGIEVFRQTNPGMSEQQATVPIAQVNLSHFFVPFDNAANTTSIALSNPDPATTATINVTFRYVDGTSNTSQLTLLPRNYTANLLASLFSATAGKAGVAEFTSNVPVAVVEVRFNPTQAFTSLRAVSP